MNKGKLISKHPLNSTSTIGVLIVFLVASFGLNEYIKSKNMRPSEAMLFLFFGFLLLITWETLKHSYNQWLKPSVTVYENGLHYSDRRKNDFWRWNDFDNIMAHKSSAYAQIGSYGLYIREKRVLLVNTRFQDAVVLANYIFAQLNKQRDYQHCLDKEDTIGTEILQVTPSGITLKKGMTVGIGPVQVNNVSMKSGDGITIPWQDINSVYQRKHFTEFQVDYLNGKSITINTINIPDAPLLIQFIANKLEQLVKTPIMEEIPTDDNSLTADSTPKLQAEVNLAMSRIIFRTILGIVGIGVWIYVTIPGIVSTQQYDLIDWKLIGWGMLGLIVPLASIMYLVKNGKLLLIKPRFIANAAGLHYYSRFTESHWQWQDFSDISIIKIYNWFGSSVALTLDIAGKRVLTLDNNYYARYDVITAAIQQRHMDSHYPGYKKEFLRGKPVSFTPITLNMLGIRYYDKQYSWSEVKSFDVSNESGETSLFIYGHDENKLFQETIFGIPNFNILTMLLSERLIGKI
jgi:hypothetical protein